MRRIHNEEFKREVVRILLTSGLKRRQVASDLGGPFDLGQMDTEIAA